MVDGFWWAMGLILALIFGVQAWMWRRARGSAEAHRAGEVSDLQESPRAMRFARSVERLVTLEMDAELQAELEADRGWVMELQDDFALKVTLSGKEHPVIAPLGMIYQACERDPSQADQMRRDFVEGLVQNLMMQEDI